MSFFKGLFNKKDQSKGEQSTPTPAQDISGIPSIVVEATENLFPKVDDQNSAFKSMLELTERGKRLVDPIYLLAILCYSQGNIEKLRLAVSNMRYPHFWFDEIAPIFPTMRKAEEWVESIKKPRT